MRIVSRILAATDFSPASHSALVRAGQLAAQHAAELRVIHATPDWNLFSAHASMPQQHYAEISAGAARLLQKETTWLATEFAIPVMGETHQGKASQAIARSVEAYQPNLLVIGARGEHAAHLTPAALGGTTLKLLTQVKVPTLLVRSESAIPYNISLAAIGPADEQAKRIVHWANALTREHCHIVRAYEVPYLERLRLSGTSAAAIAKCNTDMAARYAADPPWSKEHGSGPQMHMHLVRGSPETMVLSEVARLTPQLVVIGRHAERALDSAHPLMGCVGVRIAYHCPVDVLIVP
jgi:nucleotide-binding universal stress UspA family protein